MVNARIPSPVATSGNGGGLGWGPCVVALLTLALTSCAYVQPVRRASEPHLVALDAAECRAVLRDDAPIDSLRQGVARSLDRVRKQAAKEWQVFDRRVSAAELELALHTIDTMAGEGEWPQQLCDRLRLYRVEPRTPLLVTGYYQPELPASRVRTETFRYPVYRTPDDLVDVDVGQLCPACAGRVTQGRVRNGNLVPYYTRAEIEAGALAGRGYEIAWLDDPVEAFFLHVQGSALLRFDDDVHLQISYSSSNGRAYTSIGRLLIEQGKMARDAITLGTLKDYLRAHREEQPALMAANQRYIFFRAVVAGPIGSLGVPLTAGRSIAADLSIYPPGALAWLRIQPRAPQSVNVARLVVVQDAGAAITGPNRVDVFWGTGATAEAIAGEMQNAGELYLVLPQ
jgi:peptidoglycan lytic transglycosylase A